MGAIPGSTVEHAPIMVREVLNTNLKVVSGYKGTADVRLALDSGEVDGFFNTWTSSKVTSMDKVKSGEWVVLAQLTETPMKDLIVPNVPTIQKIARSEEQRLLLLQSAWWNWPEAELHSLADKLCSDDIEGFLDRLSTPQFHGDIKHFISRAPALG